MESVAGVGVAFSGCVLYAFLKDREMKRSLQQKAAAAAEAAAGGSGDSK